MSTNSFLSQSEIFFFRSYCPLQQKIQLSSNFSLCLEYLCFTSPLFHYKWMSSGHRPIQSVKSSQYRVALSLPVVAASPVTLCSPSKSLGSLDTIPYSENYELKIYTILRKIFDTQPEGTVVRYCTKRACLLLFGLCSIKARHVLLA